MPYNYNYHRRKRLQSEHELTLAQMMQTVLIETDFAGSAFFKYTKEVYSKTQDPGNFAPEFYVPSTTINFTAKEKTNPGTKTLSINSANGIIRPANSDEGTYNVTCDFGPYQPAKRDNQGDVILPAFEGGKHTIELVIRG